MAVIFCDGGDIQFAENTAGLWNTYFRAGVGSALWWNDTGQKRTGTGSMRWQAGNYEEYLKKNFTAVATLYGHLAMYFSATPNGYGTDGQHLLSVHRDATRHLTLLINDATHLLEVRRGNWNGTLLGTGVTPIAAGQWYSVEFALTTHDTTGAVLIKVNGVTDIDLSGVDTNNGGTDGINVFELNFGTASPGQSQYIDDLVLDDAALPGRVAVYPMTVNADGSYEQWALSGGVDTYALLDENPPLISDYIQSGTSAQKSSCTASHAVPAGATVQAVQVNVWAQLDVAGSTQFKPFVRLTGVDEAGAVKAPDVSTVAFSHAFNSKPGGGAWSQADLANVELGVEVV